MCRRWAVLACAVVAVAGCSATTPSAARGSGSRPTAAAASTAGVNATVCNRLENYSPIPTSFVEWQTYLSYAQAKVKTPGLAPKLSGEIQALIADGLAYTQGDGGALLNIQTDSHHLIATCDGYGVTSTLLGTRYAQ